MEPVKAVCVHLTSFETSVFFKNAALCSYLQCSRSLQPATKYYTAGPIAGLAFEQNMGFLKNFYTDLLKLVFAYPYCAHTSEYRTILPATPKSPKVLKI
ncbi:MAG: hypothetical protein K0Q74_38 [Gammaproteobacteria bacterium]|jgi:hypothetical protein|nr:hypothetical protein [Gammaproteobacteria bacterium]